MSASYPHSVTDLREEQLSYSTVQEYTLIGKTLGNRYRVLREIGSGGMAWVYLAEDIKENELVAVKVLYPQFGEDLSYIQRFNREAKLASTLTDPHIVRVLDYGADRDVYYLVMEYIEGQNLREVLTEKGVFPWRNALEIIDQLATALEHAHPHGVVHRDIKPQNMMLTDAGLLKVLDFGIARIPTLPSLTQSGFIGSPYYVSPEQAMGEEVDIRSDIYSSGIVLYELLSGKIPFEAKSPWSIISQHVTNEPPPIKLPEGTIPDEVHRLLDRMIAKRPEDRFPTPTALRRAITAILAGQAMPNNTLDTQPIAPPDRKVMADGLYQRALKAMDSREWARAVDLLTQTLQLNPDHGEATEKLTLAERETFIISLYNAAKRAMKHERWEDAVNNLNAIIELNPTYEDVDVLLQKARRKLEEEDARQFIMTRYNEGVAHFEAERWDNAIAAFREVERLAPGYERVRQLLAEAERLKNPDWVQKITKTVDHYIPQDTWWRWSLVVVGVLAIFLIFFSFGNSDPVAGNAEVNEQLKALYEEAQHALEKGDSEQALALLNQILKEDPDYADAATLKRELMATLTPAPAATSAIVLTPAENPLAIAIENAQKAVETGQWSEALDILLEIRAADADYEKARVVSLFCDAYVGRGLDVLADISSQGKTREKEIVEKALADFKTGAIECPRRTDLRDQADRATAYLEALNTPEDQYDRLIQTLTPLVAANPNYADGNAKHRLYEAYVARGNTRQAASEIVGALSDYEAALALNVDDPSQAQIRRAELFLALSQQTGSNQPTPQIVETATVTGGTPDEPAEMESTPEPVRIRFGPPELINPENDTIFAGRFAEVVVAWQPVSNLAEDEYYDLTIMHFFADEPVYWGLATKETQVKLLPSDIGVGRAGGDRFYWWVTVRKANSAPSADSIDLPVSQPSEAKTFIWSP